MISFAIAYIGIRFNVHLVVTEGRGPTRSLWRPVDVDSASFSEDQLVLK